MLGVVVGKGSLSYPWKKLFLEARSSLRAGSRRGLDKYSNKALGDLEVL